MTLTLSRAALFLCGAALLAGCSSPEATTTASTAPSTADPAANAVPPALTPAAPGGSNMVAAPTLPQPIPLNAAEQIWADAYLKSCDVSKSIKVPSSPTQADVVDMRASVQKAQAIMFGVLVPPRFVKVDSLYEESLTQAITACRLEETSMQFNNDDNLRNQAIQSFDTSQELGEKSRAELKQVLDDMHAGKG